jgi:protein SCO1/2
MSKDAAISGERHTLLRRRPWIIVLAVVVSGVLLGACRQTPKETPKRYQLHGQILAVNTEKRELTISHGDIPNFMPAMTMIYPVASAQLLDGRTPGETVDAVLEIDNNVPKLVEIAHAGTAPLPDGANKAGMAAGVLDTGDPVPDVALIDQTDRRRSFSEWKGTPVVLTFTYTRCPLPDFCPLMDQNFVTLQRRLADDTALRGHVKLVTITFDPDHDTPSVLSAHAAKLKADPQVWTFLTGDRATIERFAGRFGVAVMHDDPADPQITHNLRTAIVGADGRVVKVYSGNEWTPGTILTDLRAVVTAGGKPAGS